MMGTMDGTVRWLKKSSILSIPRPGFKGEGTLNLRDPRTESLCLIPM